jgi:hypothetical protein
MPVSIGHNRMLFLLDANLLWVFSDKRKEMEKVILQNGGKYSAELTKKCTHLICDISFW